MSNRAMDTNITSSNTNCSTSSTNTKSTSYTFPATKSKHIIDTQTTDLQSSTELECKPFFIDLLSLNKGQLDHLRNTGLLPPLPSNDDDCGSGLGRGKASKLLGTVDCDDEEERPKIELLNDDNETPQKESSTTNNGSSNKPTTDTTSSFDPYAIRLIRKAHISYLLKALINPLSRGFVSLDASHSWMVYWCLHSLDLMGYFDIATTESCSSGEGGGLKMNDNDALKEVEVMQKADLLQKNASTLEHCWTDVTLEFSTEDVVNDVRLKQLLNEQLQTKEEDTSTSSSMSEKKKTIIGGGFGGGNQKIPHCATSYAAVLSLSIVASLGLQQQSSSHPYYQAGKLALNVLKSKRLQMYAFFLTLREHHSGEVGSNEEKIAFRMQHDGEIDVRASYCLLAPCYLLGLLNNNDDNDNPLLSSAISRYIASCQTFEGGFGAEPFNEAHGGYTFCSLAALRILGSVTLIDVNALSSWLARRQMGYEGGFCGRTNKLVDGCYSFWQGGAVAVLDGWFGDTNDELSYDELMLQRYILLCAHDVNGGLRDKHALESWPSVSSCDGREDSFNKLFGDASVNIIGRTDPVINIRKERVQFMLAQFT